MSTSEAEPVSFNQDLADLLGGPTIMEPADRMEAIQINGHLANGDLTNGDDKVMAEVISTEHMESSEDSQSQASEELAEGDADDYRQGYCHGYRDDSADYQEVRYEREGSPVFDDHAYRREGSPPLHDRSYEHEVCEGSPDLYEREVSPNPLNHSYEHDSSERSHDQSYEQEGSADEYTSHTSKSQYQNMANYQSSHEGTIIQDDPLDWHKHQIATSPPQSLRIEDTLADFQPSKRYVKPEENQKIKAPGIMIIGVSGDKMCQQCGKRVYEMEKIIADKGVYHKMCFKCLHCKRVLSLGNFASIDKQLYCKPHFIEIFKTRGNYDEGFGMERKVKQMNHSDGMEHIAETENNLQSSVEVDSKDITRAEEKVDEGLGNLPSIKSIKNRFETPGGENQAAPVPTSRSRKSSERSVESNSVNGDVRGTRKSKWDRPKEAPPPPVNRQTEYEEEEEVKSSESTKLLVSRFREIEQQGDSTVSYQERKPVHKITPPRDELAEGIEEAERVYMEEQIIVEAASQREEELPPPSFTKNMLARFRSMEEENQPPPSPARSTYSTSTSSVTRTHTSTTQSHTHIKASPDSGISDTEQQAAGHRSDDELDADVMSRSDIIRAEDKPEEDLPEQGFTKSLVAQWKQKEIASSTYTSRDPSPHSTSSQQTWGSYKRTETQTQHRSTKKTVQTPDSDISSADEHAYENIPNHQSSRGGMNGDMEESDYSGSMREVIRESDRNDEDELPPPSFTKNMLAKFQNLEQEAERETYAQASSKKQFKWTVKEAKPLHVVSTRREQHLTRTHSSNETEYNEYHEYEEHEGHNTYEAQEEFYTEVVRSDEMPEDDLPPESFTRNMLAKFRSMEDTEQVPPTPEHSEKKMKAAILSVSPGPMRQFGDTHAVHVYNDEREQSEGLEYTDGSPEYFDGYNNPVDAGEYENDPVYNPDVIREGDQFEEDLPEMGTTQHLLAKFQSMQAS